MQSKYTIGDGTKANAYTYGHTHAINIHGSSYVYFKKTSVKLLKIISICLSEDRKYFVSFPGFFSTLKKQEIMEILLNEI